MDHMEYEESMDEDVHSLNKDEKEGTMMTRKEYPVSTDRNQIGEDQDLWPLSERGSGVVVGRVRWLLRGLR
jgi:hypothetical protein